ncbi:unnamed protein product [Moneuplotes crassus]|uniref:Uncharacterized protein n=1 Tax=Euplotes crassus TaxID=5936 RepID=A0AAD1X2W2_EUPCR|nr:unnamed protein product [Moneuplotes crassus]
MRNNDLRDYVMVPKSEENKRYDQDCLNRYDKNIESEISSEAFIPRSYTQSGSGSDNLSQAFSSSEYSDNFDHVLPPGQNGSYEATSADSRSSSIRGSSFQGNSDGSNSNSSSAKPMRNSDQDLTHNFQREAMHVVNEESKSENNEIDSERDDLESDQDEDQSIFGHLSPAPSQPTPETSSRASFRTGLNYNPY